MKRRIQPQISAFGGVLIAVFGLSSPASAAKPPILVAAFEGDLSGLQAELEAGTDVETCNSKGLTALMLASGRGHLAIIEAVLKAGANIDAQSKHGWSALWLAAAKGQTEAVQVLLQAGANREAQDQLERPPPWLAAARGHVEVVRALLSAGAKTNARSSDGGTALMVAASEGHPEVVRLLVQAGADVNTRELRSLVSPLMYAAEHGDPETVRILLDAGADVNARSDGDWQHLRMRSRTNRRIPPPSWDGGINCYLTSDFYSFLKIGLAMSRAADGYEFDRPAWTALIVAAANGHVEVVRSLLAAGARLNDRSGEDATPLAHAWANKRVGVIRLLTALGAERAGDLERHPWRED